jgi:hypothetical protein
MSEKKKSVFETLSAINVNDKVEKKNGLTYLSWAWAWGEVKKVYPSASYRIIRDPNTGEIYTYSKTLGYMVMTEVEIEGEALEMWLPVMDGANKPMKSEYYTYQSTKWESGRKILIDKTVDAADMFDINKTLMRCLTKNLAMFGLGHYIFAGEDLPEVEPVVSAPVKATPSIKEDAQAKKQLKKGTEDWDKVVKWLGENKSKSIDDIEKILKQRFTVTPAALKEIKTILDTNG